MMKVVGLSCLVAVLATTANLGLANGKEKVQIDGDSEKILYKAGNLQGEVCFKGVKSDGTAAKYKWWYTNAVGWTPGQKTVTGKACHEFIGHTEVRVGFSFDGPITVRITSVDTSVYIKPGIPGISAE